MLRHVPNGPGLPGSTRAAHRRFRNPGTRRDHAPTRSGGGSGISATAGKGFGLGICWAGLRPDLSGREISGLQMGPPGAASSEGLIMRARLQAALTPAGRISKRSGLPQMQARDGRFRDGQDHRSLHPLPDGSSDAAIPPKELHHRKAGANLEGKARGIPDGDRRRGSARTRTSGPQPGLGACPGPFFRRIALAASPARRDRRRRARAVAPRDPQSPTIARQICNANNAGCVAGLTSAIRAARKGRHWLRVRGELPCRSRALPIPPGCRRHGPHPKSRG